MPRIQGNFQTCQACQEDCHTCQATGHKHGRNDYTSSDMNLTTAHRVWLKQIDQPKSDTATSPNTAPATQSVTDKVRWKHVKRPLHCATDPRRSETVLNMIRDQTRHRQPLTFNTSGSWNWVFFSVTLPFCYSFLSHSTWKFSNSTSFWSLTSWTSIVFQVCLFPSGNLEFGTCFRLRNAQVWWTTAEECGNGTQAFSASCALDGADASERGASAPMSILVLGADGKPFHTFCSLAINWRRKHFWKVLLHQSINLPVSAHPRPSQWSRQKLHWEMWNARNAVSRLEINFCRLLQGGCTKDQSQQDVQYIEWLWMIHSYTLYPYQRYCISINIGCRFRIFRALATRNHCLFFLPNIG